MQTKVNVEGFGTFQIDAEKVSELLNWLSSNNGISIPEKNIVKEVKDNQFTGRTLVNE